MNIDPKSYLPGSGIFESDPLSAALRKQKQMEELLAKQNDKRQELARLMMNGVPSWEEFCKLMGQKPWPKSFPGEIIEVQDPKKIWKPKTTKSAPFKIWDEMVPPFDVKFMTLPTGGMFGSMEKKTYEVPQEKILHCYRCGIVPQVISDRDFMTMKYSSTITCCGQRFSEEIEFVEGRDGPRTPVVLRNQVVRRWNHFVRERNRPCGMGQYIRSLAWK